jgi:hypothetical protein
MILHCNFEELSAVGACAGRLREGVDSGGVAAPPEILADIDALAARLSGDLTVASLHELRVVRRALEFLLADARARTDAFIIAQTPAAESAILSYFEYAHLLSLVDRATRLGEQMTAMIEIMTGQPVTDEAARNFSFPE